MITNKIKALLALKGLKFQDYADGLQIAKQSLNNKANREAYKIKDLIVLGKITNTRLAFIDEENKPVILFDEEDISKPAK